MSVVPLKKAPTPLELRDELEAMVLKELLGPGSAEEELIESPRHTLLRRRAGSSQTSQGRRCPWPRCRRATAAPR